MKLLEKRIADLEAVFGTDCDPLGTVKTRTVEERLAALEIAAGTPSAGTRTFEERLADLETAAAQ